MEDVEKIKEVCDLLKIWFFFRTSGTIWPQAVSAIEARIEYLMPRPAPGKEEKS